MPPPWKEYQEKAAVFFRCLGLKASADVTMQGVRTGHDVDVLVEMRHVGFNIFWIVECKHWKTPVSKLHVLALREIVSDTGADRGILLSEAGFQSGAKEAASLTNVQVTSLADLSITAKESIHAMKLHELYDRIDSCREAYWSIPKAIRIARGIRPDVGYSGYSGAHVIETGKALLSYAFRGRYPIELEPSVTFEPLFPERYGSHEEVVAALDPILRELEAKLAV